MPMSVLQTLSLQAPSKWLRPRAMGRPFTHASLPVFAVACNFSCRNGAEEPACSSGWSDDAGSGPNAGPSFMIVFHGHSTQSVRNNACPAVQELDLDRGASGHIESHHTLDGCFAHECCQLHAIAGLVRHLIHSWQEHVERHQWTCCVSADECIANACHALPLLGIARSCSIIVQQGGQKAFQRQATMPKVAQSQAQSLMPAVGESSGQLAEFARKSARSSVSSLR